MKNLVLGKIFVVRKEIYKIYIQEEIFFNQKVEQKIWCQWQFSMLEKQYKKYDAGENFLNRKYSLTNLALYKFVKSKKWGQ